MPNVELTPLPRMSTFRKLAVGTWQDAYDPAVYGYLTIRMDKALRYLERFREAHGVKLTVTQLVGKAVAGAIAEVPQANAILRYNRIYLRPTVDLVLHVAIKGDDDSPPDLSVVKVVEADKRSLLEWVEIMEERVEKVRNRTDEELEKTRSSVAAMPLLLMNRFLKTLSFLLYTLNLDLRWAGIAKDPFGSAFITSIGSLGLEAAFVPLAPYTRVPLFVAPGAIRRVPVVQDDDSIAPESVMTLAATFDHRFIDGVDAARLAKVVQRWLEDPDNHFDALT